MRLCAHISTPRAPRKPVRGPRPPHSYSNIQGSIEARRNAFRGLGEVPRLSGVGNSAGQDRGVECRRGVRSARWRLQTAGRLPVTLPSTVKVQNWMKALHDRPERRADDFWRNLRWVSDSHYLKHGEPMLRPSYRVNDLIVLYLSGIRRCPAIARVEATADFDPERVERGARPGDGQRWGWVTEIEVLAFCPVDQVPSLDAVGVDGKSMQRRSRLKIEPVQFEAAKKAISAASPGS